MAKKSYPIFLSLFFIFFFFLFKDFITSKITELIVLPFLSKAVPSKLTDFILVLIGILFTVFAVNTFFKRYIISTSLFLLITIPSLVYFYYRCDKSFVFYGFKSYSSIYYFDILFLFFFYTLLLKFITPLKSVIEEKTKKFIIDIPITDSNNDLLSRKEYAFELAERIIATPNDKAFAIGINGIWGSGKTSYMNLIKEKIPKEFIVVDFNPWSSMDSKGIIKDFFNTLASKLKSYSSEFGEIAKIYSDHLSDKDYGISKILNFSFYSKDDSLAEYYSRLNEILKELDIKVLIFIDDLDRLDKQEVFEVLRLIRNTADFNNVFYIAAYDRNYVKESIKGYVTDKDARFLEKIFQVEHPLPFINRSNIIDVLYAHLVDTFPEDQKIKEHLIDKKDLLAYCLDTIRDAKRFLNSFIYGYSRIKGEVVFADFFNLEILKLKYPLVYDDLYNNNYYLEYYQKYVDAQPLFYKEAQKDIGSIKEYLTIRKDKLQLSEEDSIEEVLKFLNTIFSKKDFSYSKDINPLSISLSENFHKYFQLVLLENDLSEIEFKIALNKTYEEFTGKIEEWISEGKRWSVIGKLKALKLNEFENQYFFEKIVKSYWFIGNCSADENKALPIDVICSLIGDHNTKEIVRNFYKGDKTKYESFIRGLLENAVSPYHNETSLIRHILIGYDDIVLSSEELRKINLTYFDNTIQHQVKDFKNFDIYKIYHSNVHIGNGKEIKKRFKEYLKDGYLKYFLVHSIRYDTPKDPEELVYGINIREFFDSIEEFEELLKSEPDSDPAIVEFKEFYEKFVTNDRRYVDFEFKELPVVKISK